MTGRESLLDICHDTDWSVLHSDKRKIVFFRWDGDRRIEMSVVFDGQGRIHAWSLWESARITSPDHEPGNRQRCEAMMT